MASSIFRALSVALLLVLLAAPFAPAQAGSSHPYFDDGGTLVWYHRLADAQRAARAEGKLIFIEYGRRRCGSCKVLCNRILPDPRIRSRLSAVAVGLAAECDRPERAVHALFERHLRNAHMLPFAAFITPDGEWVTGFAGSGRTESFLGHLSKAERARPRTAARRTPAPQPVMRPAPQPRPAPPRREARRTPTPPAPDRIAVTPSAPAPAPTPPAKVDTPCIAPRPPSIEIAEAARRGTTSPSRVTRSKVPPPRLSGSPDAQVVEFPPSRSDLACDPCRITRRRDVRDSALPAPVVADVRSSASARKERTAVSKPAAPARRGAPTNADALWADEKLDFAADAVAAGRFEDGLAAIEQVLDRMPGETAFVDAARGLDAIKRLLQQRFLDPDGQVAKAARRMAYEDMWGTRWAKLFK